MGAQTIEFYVGISLSYFGLAFIIMGIIYLIGWRKSPLWRSRFWWITFALTGVFALLIGKSLVLGFLFFLVAVVIYLVMNKRGEGKPALQDRTHLDNNTLPNSFHEDSSSEIEKTHKKCPKCAELVKAEALICRFCRCEFLSPEEMKRQEDQRIAKQTELLRKEELEAKAQELEDEIQELKPKTQEFEKGKEIPEPQLEARAGTPDVQETKAIEHEFFKKHAEGITHVEIKEPESGEVWKDPYLGMEFVYVKGGSFEMGDTFGDGESDEQPVHAVLLEDFYIGKCPVTQYQWKQVMGNSPSFFFGRGNYPVESVSWEDVQEFVRRFNQATNKSYRLPIEAEWEFAARSRGRNEKWAGTNSEDEINKYAWFKNNSGNQTHPIGQKDPNGLGLYDMSGNVWEWVEDWYVEGYSRSRIDNNPTDKDSERRKVIRGGSWTDSLRNLRTSNREGKPPYEKGVVVGFRLALPAKYERPYTAEKEQLRLKPIWNNKR